MILERYLRERQLSELREFYSFWDTDGKAPDETERLVHALYEHMTDVELVRKRLRFLSKKLVDLLKFLLRNERYQAGLVHILNSKTFAYMSQYEVEAALNALRKRGFVFATGEPSSKNGNTVFLVPRELGDILGGFLWEADRDLRDTLCLQGFLGEMGDRLGAVLERVASGNVVIETPPPAGLSVESVRARLVRPEEIAHRRGQLDEPLRPIFDLAVWRHGGILSKGAYERARPRLPRWDRAALKVGFEKACLGTVRHLALGEYGINHFDDTLIVFEEVVSTALAEFEGPEPFEPDEVRSLGVDFISDISSFLSFVANSRIRLTLNGHIYRTAIKKVSEHFILSRKEEFTERQVFDLIYAFSTAKKLVQRRPDRSLTLTIKGRSWESMPLEKKLKILLVYVRDEQEAGADRFHTPRLREMVLEQLDDLPLNRWFDANFVPWRARNRYLARLDDLGVREAFQNRYQYTTNAAMRDVSQLAHSASAWLHNRLYLLGLVDIALCDGKRAGLRLTMLGARALGRELDPEQVATQKPLVVNPDFEVIVFPDGDLYDLVCKLDRFCERIKSGTAYHYRITCASVEQAVAQGTSAAEILTVLSEHARTDIPQNVIYSIKEWAESVKFVSLQQVTVLRARNKEVVERIMHRPSLRKLVRERLAPTVLLLADDADFEELARKLEKIGVFIDDRGVAGNGGENGES